MKFVSCWVLILLFITSCDRERCYTCTTTATSSIDGISETASTDYALCGTKSEIRDAEEAGTYTQNIGTYSVRANTKCERD